MNPPKKKIARPSLAELDSVLHSSLAPQLEKIISARRKIYGSLLTTILAILPLGYFLTLVEIANIEAIKIIVGLSFPLAFWLVHRKYKTYREIFKSEVMVPVCREFFPDLVYRPESCISKSFYDEAELFRSELDNYSGNDHFRGKIGEVDFEFSELNCSYETGSGKNRRRVQVFKGFFFVGDFHREIYFRTKVQPDLAENVLGILGRGIQRVFSGNRLVDLEDPEFEKLFRVTSDDQVEARYILTPKFMETLKEFRNRIGVNVSVSFVNSKMFLAVYTNEDYFEPRLFGDVFRRKDLMHFIDTVNLMLKVAEEFLHHPKFGAQPPQMARTEVPPLLTPPPLTWAQQAALKKKLG
jgi:hypothetical protein